jgi:hypothetical protein
MVVADQLGHTLDVNLNIYPQTSLERKIEALESLEASRAFVISAQSHPTWMMCMRFRGSNSQEDSERRQFDVLTISSQPLWRACTLHSISSIF